MHFEAARVENFTLQINGAQAKQKSAEISSKLLPRRDFIL